MKTIKEVLKSNLDRLIGDRSLKEISAGSGVPYRTIQDMRAGRVPRGKNLAKLAKFFDVDEPVFFLDPERAGIPSPEDVAAAAERAVTSGAFSAQFGAFLRGFLEHELE